MNFDCLHSGKVYLIVAIRIVLIISYFYTLFKSRMSVVSSAYVINLQYLLVITISFMYLLVITISFMYIINS